MTSLLVWGRYLRIIKRYGRKWQEMVGKVEGSRRERKKKCYGLVKCAGGEEGCLLHLTRYLDGYVPRYLGTWRARVG